MQFNSCMGSNGEWQWVHNFNRINVRNGQHYCVWACCLFTSSMKHPCSWPLWNITIKVELKNPHSCKDQQIEWVITENYLSEMITSISPSSAGSHGKQRCGFFVRTTVDFSMKKNLFWLAILCSKSLFQQHSSTTDSSLNSSNTRPTMDH